jgi:hypothetical protein
VLRGANSITEGGWAAWSLVAAQPVRFVSGFRTQTEVVRELPQKTCGGSRERAPGPSAGGSLPLGDAVDVAQRRKRRRTTRSVLGVLERELVDVAARVADPGHDHAHGQDDARDRR